MNKPDGLVTAGLNAVGILAAGDEAAALEHMLADQALDCRPTDATMLAEAIRSGSLSAAIVTDEALDALDVEALGDAIADQPAWSDFPFLLLIEREGLAARSRQIAELGHVAIVERPLEAAVLSNAVKSALRARERQVESKLYVRQREQAEEQLRQLTLTLESRVKVRMAELRAAHDRVSHEVQERRAAEERLRESEELYRNTLELGDQLVWTAAPDGSLLSMSPRYWKLTGLSPEDPPSLAVHPDDRADLLAKWKSAVAEGRNHFIEYRLRLSDGSYRHYRARASARRDEEGRIVRWYGTTEDIHDRKQAQEALLVAEERYRLAARATNDAIWDLDVRKDEIHWSKSASGFFGYIGREHTTSVQWWLDRVHPEERERVSQSLSAAIGGSNTHWSEEYRFEKADGSYADILDRGYIIRTEQGEPLRVVGAMADLTERRRAEDELKRLQGELIHVSRVSAMGTMGSTLAHELNQPLTAVTNYIRGSRRMLEAVDVPAVHQVREALEAAEGGALRAGQIVRRLRELVARGNVSARTAELPKLIHDACVLAFVDEQRHGIIHRVELDPAAYWVRADAIQIQQVLINLVRNAVDAMIDQPRREVVIASRSVSGGMVEISVEDTGVGLTDEVHAGLFSPFQSGKAEGMGIGLSISRTIVEAHGGNIWAESLDSGGAAFRFTLPRAEEPRADDLNYTEPLAAE